MSTVATKIGVGAIASAFAAVTALGAAPVSSAQGAPEGAVGGGLGSALAECDPTVEVCEEETGLLGLDDDLFQNHFVWIGPAPDDLPEQFLVATWDLYNSTWPPAREFFSWLYEIDYTICVAGLTARLVPYDQEGGGASIALTRGCEG